MQSFLENVLNELLLEYENVEKLTFVLPSKRASTFLKKHLSAHIDKPIFSPEVYSIEEFVAEIANLNYASNTELLFELYKSYLKVFNGEKDDFNSFLKWGQTLLQDFNEIDRYLIDDSELFSYLSSIQKLKNWGVENKKTALVANYIAFWNSLPAIYSEFNSQLINKRLGYQGLVYRLACKRVGSYIDDAKNKDFVFIGFNALNEAESRIIQSFLSQGNTDIYFDIDGYFLEDKVHSVSHFIRHYKKSWPYYKSNPLKGITENYLKGKSIKIVGVPKSISQAKYVGGLIKKLSTPDTNNLRNTALVLADENLLNPILNSIPKCSTQINITMGLSIRNSALSNFFESLFQLHIDKNKNGLFYKEILSFLSNPYTSILLTENGVDYSKTLQDKININNWVYLKSEHILAVIPTKNTLCQRLFNTLLNAASLLELLHDSVVLLKEKIALEHSTYDLEQLYHIYQILNQIEEQLSAHSFITETKSLKSLFFELLSHETLDFKGDPINGLQIMGMLESRVLDFDTVIITSVNEGILPSGKNNNSFIPYDVKQEFGLPTYKEKDAIYTYHFYRLLQRAKNIYLIYNTEPDVLEGGEKSRFINQLLTDENVNANITHTIAAPTVKSNTVKNLSVEKSPLLIEELKALAKNGFSPTSLTNYIRNPLGFYKKNILKIDIAQEVEESIAHNTFGTIIHDSLEDLYRPIVSQTLTNEVLLGLKEKVPTIVEHNFIKVNPESDLTKGKNLITYNVIIKYLEDFLKNELLQLKKHKIKILGIEQSLAIELTIPSLNFPVFLKGKLDRVDEIDGQLRIIDYKTGKVESSEVEIIDWDSLIEDKKYNKAFQLLCYALMYQEKEYKSRLEAGIIPIKKSSVGIYRFATKPSPRGTKNHTIDAQVLSEFKMQLYKLVEEIFNSSIPFIEKDD
ncbi:PD-(D/E)XK nuclease family protein [Croceitalea sp. MTPC9]|uniref:PD-(D/E)XK nuclease family protein n=1 Tax=unclassified Croceitalea TaxID=2632280 RepID=UPI002B3F1787|nr:PD-(D/E)XK nuclease family protein [Croceitalea sp. MTPC6]GMN16730.1 PD-(D/E)XK nuclease family protein [Croceitalea sp. MTPC9]